MCISWFVVRFMEPRYFYNERLRTEVNDKKNGRQEHNVYFYSCERIFTKNIAYRPKINEMRPLDIRIVWSYADSWNTDQDTHAAFLAELISRNEASL